jgi:hypothetical protein
LQGWGPGGTISAAAGEGEGGGGFDASAAVVMVVGEAAQKLKEEEEEEGGVDAVMGAEYLFDFRRINIYFLFCRTNSVCDLIFCLILYMVNYGRVGKCIIRKSKRYAAVVVVVVGVAQR